jgi:hypothetical protein
MITILIIVFIPLVFGVWILFGIGERIAKRYPNSLFARIWEDYVCMGIPDDEDM